MSEHAKDGNYTSLLAGPANAIALDGCRIERVLDHSVEIIDATSRNRTFPDRINESLGICLKAGPDNDVKADGRSIRYPADSICIRAPGTVWSTQSTGYAAFLSIDIEATLLPLGGVAGPMRFIERAELPSLDHSVGILRSEASTLAKESVVAELVDDLIQGGIVAAPELDSGIDLRGVARAREMLTDRIADPPSLQQLADAVGANRFVLLRSFRRTVGVPPHTFVLRLRIERARMRLARGADITETSLELGFADQSHMTRAFKSVVGMSPGAYRRAMRPVAGQSIPFKK